MCDAVPVMDKAAEKAGLERLLGTANTLGLQQLDDMQTKEDSPDAGGDQAGGDVKAKQPSGAIDRPGAGPSSFCVQRQQACGVDTGQNMACTPTAAEPVPRILDHCPRTVSPSGQVLT